MRRQRWCENIVSTWGSCTCMASLPLELAPSRIRAHPIGGFLQTLLSASPALVFARIRQEDRNHRRGLFQDRKLHLLQQAFTDYGGFQCGIYTEVKS